MTKGTVWWISDFILLELHIITRIVWMTSIYHCSVELIVLYDVVYPQPKAVVDTLLMVIWSFQWEWILHVKAIPQWELFDNRLQYQWFWWGFLKGCPYSNIIYIPLPGKHMYKMCRLCSVILRQNMQKSFSYSTSMNHVTDIFVTCVGMILWICGMFLRVGCQRVLPLWFHFWCLTIPENISQ